MRTVVTVPDSLFAKAEDLAQRLGKSRNQLYTEAIAEYVARHDDHEITRRMNETLEAVGGLAPEDEAVLAAGARTIRDNVEW
jgi:metal-responsive CopG/Arc/MetJ family transcriptional regulator